MEPAGLGFVGPHPARRPWPARAAHARISGDARGQPEGDAGNGGQDYNPQASAYPSGMPRMMIAYEPMEFVVTPEVTYIRSDH